MLSAAFENSHSLTVSTPVRNRNILLCLIFGETASSERETEDELEVWEHLHLHSDPSHSSSLCLNVSTFLIPFFHILSALI